MTTSAGKGNTAFVQDGEFTFAQQAHQGGRYGYCQSREAGDVLSRPSGLIGAARGLADVGRSGVVFGAGLTTGLVSVERAGPPSGGWH